MDPSGFWKRVRVDPSGCWIWTGTKVNKNDLRGEVLVNGKWVYAHRYSYMISHGPIPPGLQVLHTCDVPACVRPHHLKVGTIAQNRADMFLKGRSLYGERNPSHKLKESEVRTIRIAVRKGVPHKVLGKMYGCHSTNIGLIARGQRWRHVWVAPRSHMPPKELTGG